MTSTVDRFRNRKPLIPPADGRGWDTEEVLFSSPYEDSAEGLQVLLCKKRDTSVAVIRTSGIEEASKIRLCPITLGLAHIEGVLEGMATASIWHHELLGVMPEDIPNPPPLVCHAAGDVVVKLRQDNGFFTIRIFMKRTLRCAFIRPYEIEGVIAALVQAHDRISGSQGSGIASESLPF